ncbi:histone deacetylase family protein [Thermocoleostomius sinensis]|uniref:Histone deacetylase family protein n=1 Tax=Thermocoleostomius sinensis A174 TaxID=2016057 RepID=A0A9E9CAP8_9CYAN|nr:histone deacetylase family protein [Thermocoleostomius sinensis]WAL59210.1 histone deacetylase family protein [Thermocoleostomius sinensis A174]
MLTIYSPDHRHQDAHVELTDGQLVAPYENPKRADRILSQIQQADLGMVLPPKDFGLAPILRVHDRGFVSFLQSAWSEWLAAHGEFDALPLNWATRTMRHDRIPETIEGKLSYYSFDAGTPIIAGTWQAAMASAQVALTGQDWLVQGERSVFSLCRPPGHHAARDLYGGYCFLNNAAIAAQALLDAGAERVAIFDVDYHHGNGTQAIFYDRSDVLFVSIHAHPSHSYPYFLGFEDETGAGVGEGFTRNYPLPLGTDWKAYAEPLEQALNTIRHYAPDAVVVSLGVDTYEADPISSFRLQSHDFHAMGQAIARLNKPTLIVMEGGYALEAIGVNVGNFLQGVEEG